MKTRRHYTRPTIECICLSEEQCLLEDLSMDIGGGSAPDGGHAKQGFLDEEEEEENGWGVWEE